MERQAFSASIQRQFVFGILTEDAERIRSLQQKVIADYNLKDSGKLFENMKGNFSVNAIDGKSSLRMSYLTYARFLDLNDPRRRAMKKGYQLYNRIVFGVIYNHTYINLKYGFTDKVRGDIVRQLKKAYEIFGDKNTSFDDFVMNKFSGKK